MTAERALELLDRLENAGMQVWVDGGWGVDALLGAQTRDHADLDVVVRIEDTDGIRSLLEAVGFRLEEDQRPTRFVLAHPDGRKVDFHPVSFDEGGGGNQVQHDGSVFRYPPDGFRGSGTIALRPVRCLTPEVQILCHLGYAPEATDVHDVGLLTARFALPVPPAYRDLVKAPASDLVFLTGPPGVGKTTVARLVFQALPEAAWLDGDDVWRIRPFQVNERTKRLVEANIPHVLRGYLEAGYPLVLLSWVLHRQDLIDRIRAPLRGLVRTERVFTLLASEDELARRCAADPSRGPLDEIGRERLRQARTLGTEKIDTTGRTAEDVAAEITERLSAAPPAGGAC